MSEKHTVGVVARLVGVSVRTLHHYDEIGLVAPSDRTTGGYRSYSDADVERLHRVLTYRELGFPLEEIAALLDDPDVDALAHLRRQHALLSERIDRLHDMAAAVEKMMEAKSMGIQLTPKSRMKSSATTGRARSTPPRPKSAGATPTRGSSPSSGPRR